MESASATARVAVHLGENDAGDVQPLVEALRDLDRILTRHAVGDEENLIGVDRGLEPLQLLHHLVVDLKAAGGVDDHDTVARALRLLDAVLRDADDVLRVPLGVDRSMRRRAGVQGSRAGRWRRADRSSAAIRRVGRFLGLEPPGELRRGGRFSRALEADHHDDGGRHGAQLEPLATLAEHGRELVVDDFDELLSGRDGAELTDADGFLLDALEELARQLKIHVGLEQHATHFPKAVFDVGFGQNAATAQPRKRRFEFLGQLVEHRPGKIDQFPA